LSRKRLAGDFDIGKIDEVIHGRVRLGIMAYLMAAEVADFNTLKAKLETTDGTVSVHMRKLEDAGYVTIEKTFKGRRPLTRIRLTTAGRRAFRSYLDTIGKLAGLAD
jgi:DNA-binding MarR family transcriptional regulator